MERDGIERVRMAFGRAEGRAAGLSGIAELGWSRVSAVSASLGSLPADAALVSGRLERQAGIAESSVSHVPQGKGLLFCVQSVHFLRGLMRDLRFPRLLWLRHIYKNTFGDVVC